MSTISGTDELVLVRVYTFSQFRQFLEQRILHKRATTFVATPPHHLLKRAKEQKKYHHSQQNHHSHHHRLTLNRNVSLADRYLSLELDDSIKRVNLYGREGKTIRVTNTWNTI